MTLDRILPFTKYLLEKCVVAGDLVVDATCGNGHDAIFLSQIVGNQGQVFAFDVQKEAITKAQMALKEAGIKNVTLILDGHENALNYIDNHVSAAIFNLGYLPGSDKTLTTNGPTTWKAVTNLLTLLKTGGIIILVIYHGHAEGKVERDYLEKAITTLDTATTAVLKYEFLNKANAPYIIAIEKIK